MAKKHKPKITLILIYLVIAYAIQFVANNLTNTTHSENLSYALLLGGLILFSFSLENKVAFFIEILTIVAIIATTILFNNSSLVNLTILATGGTIHSIYLKIRSK